ncbi:AMP-binding protein [Pseudomonas sp. App30]|uniref:AMP-binding protein n=1 Tax=Pseudomonas sp. App30 TaxID=3068990 RepID=UPI003A8043A8
MDEATYLAQLQQRWAQAWPADVPRTAQYPLGERPLTEYLRHWATVQPDHPALHFYGHSLTYRELDQLSDRCAALLRSLGVAAGDRVAVLLPNCPQMHIAFLGILKCGAVHAPVSPLSQHLELAHQLGDCGATVLIGLDQLLPLVQQVRDRTALRTLIATSLSELRPARPTLPVPDLLKAPKRPVADALDFYPALAACQAAVPEHPVQLDDIAALNYTGGTTGLPKGCIHTHRDMLYTCASFVPTALGCDRHAVSLNFLPQFWIAGENAGLLFPLYSGCSLVFPSELEALLGQHPAVLASAVLGRAHAVRGQEPVAFIVLKPGSEETADSLVQWCLGAMARYKVPQVRLVEGLPMTATGKVKKQELEALL